MTAPPRRPVFFRDFTWVNRLLLALALGLAGIIVGQKLGYRGWERQYWSTDVCSAPGERLALVEGYCGTTAAETVPLDWRSYWVRPSTDSLYGQGSFFTYHALPGDYDENALNLPPRTLRVAWYSWRDNQFYQGTFELPRARIDSLRAVYRARTDTTGWRFNQQPRDYDAPQPPSEPGFVLSVQLQAGGHLRLDVLEAHNQDYARPVPLAHYRAAPYRPAFAPDDLGTRYARSLPAYRDTLLAHLDSTSRAALPGPAVRAAAPARR